MKAENNSVAFTVALCCVVLCCVVLCVVFCCVLFCSVLFCYVLPSFVAVAQCSAQLRHRSDHPGTPHGDLLAGGAGAPGQGTGILDAGWINRDRRSERQKTPTPFVF
jgi:hypothetical protein